MARKRAARTGLSRAAGKPTGRDALFAAPPELRTNDAATWFDRLPADCRKVPEYSSIPAAGWRTFQAWLFRDSCRAEWCRRSDIVPTGWDREPRDATPAMRRAAARFVGGLL